MMSPEDKQAWLDALRSGKYSQTMNTLKDCDGYCCLGVLVSAVGVPEEEGREVQEYPDLIKINTSFGGCLSAILPWTAECALFEGNKAGLTYGEFAARCMDMNDDEGKSFAEIADWLEVNL